jgi:hypothetical protein
VKLKTIGRRSSSNKRLHKYEMLSLITRNERRSILMAEKFTVQTQTSFTMKKHVPINRCGYQTIPHPRDSGIEDPDLPAFKTQLEVDAMEEPVDQLEVGAQSLPGNALAIASEESLVTSATVGMHLAYAELCRRHSIKTSHVVQRITRNKEDAEDALQ